MKKEKFLNSVVFFLTNILLRKLHFHIVYKYNVLIQLTSNQNFPFEIPDIWHRYCDRGASPQLRPRLSDLIPLS